MLEGGSRVAIATHDEALLAASLDRVAGLGPDGYEFQMLLGVREGRATELVAAGHPLRVYVPFGQRWYEYSLRRLQENPHMAGVIAKATMARAVGAEWPSATDSRRHSKKPRPGGEPGPLLSAAPGGCLVHPALDSLTVAPPSCTATL